MRTVKAAFAQDGTCLFVADYALSQAGDAIAEQTGLTSAIVGFALIGTATSLPELVTVMTALKLNREIAFGQVSGTNSSICLCCRSATGSSTGSPW